MVKAIISMKWLSACSSQFLPESVWTPAMFVTSTVSSTLSCLPRMLSSSCCNMYRRDYKQSSIEIKYILLEF